MNDMKELRCKSCNSHEFENYHGGYQCVYCRVVSIPVHKSNNVPTSASYPARLYAIRTASSKIWDGEQ